MPWERNDTKERMVTSAALLLREHGVSGTSFAKVLEHSGAPRGSVSHHFPGGKREMVADAVRFAGGAAGAAMRHVVERGGSPADVVAMICRIYRRALVDSDFAAACPVGAVAQEGYDDPPLRDAVRDVFADWRTTLTDALSADGHPPDHAAELAELCIAGVEGALMLARVEQDSRSLDRVERRLTALLSRRTE